MSVVALIDYGSGNLRSAQKALERAAVEQGKPCEVQVTNDPAQVAGAGRIVLPGVGAFGDCMMGLSSIAGMVEALRDSVLSRHVPFLGICVGMQLLAAVGREFGEHAGLGWIEGDVARIAPSDRALKIPHMGWNALAFTRPHPLFDGVENGSDVYFVHSFAMRPRDDSDVIATSDYGGPIVAAIARGNIAGVQFHPEKSQAAGLRILRNFLGWRP
ncbi:MAG TPA: imidazole glycerol phosphate synthase subunit HisH [Rhizomicrobium sp.]|nr:imidazole glycerol phosphate synthase subunit HisH [Rhizomicrobium sp.]